MAGRRRLSGAFLVNINRIEPDPDQPRKRIDPTHLAELAKSVKRLGVLQPITVRFIEEADRYRIIAGECRYTASKQAGLQEIPCWVKNPKADEILLEQIVENWQRQDLNPFELADSLAILRDASKLSQAELSDRTGKSAGITVVRRSTASNQHDRQQCKPAQRTRRISHPWALQSAASMFSIQAFGFIEVAAVVVTLLPVNGWVRKMHS